MSLQTTDFETHRSHLFGIAYRMTGSVMDAEDIVQDVFLRMPLGLPRAPARNFPGRVKTTGTQKNSRVFFGVPEAKTKYFAYSYLLNLFKC